MSGVGCLGSVYAGLWLTDSRCLRSWLTLTPLENSQSRHKISFFFSLPQSLSTTNTQSFSLCSHPVRSLAFSLCLSYTHMRFLYLPFALSLWSLQLWPGAPSAPSFSALLSGSSREARQRCQETDSARSAAEPATIGHGGHLAIPAKMEFTILPPGPSHRGQRGSIRSQPASETRTKPTRPPQRAHRGQDTFSDSTIQQLRWTQTRPHKPRHGQIITNQFSRSQTQTRPLNITGGIWNHPRPLSVYHINSWSQRHQRTTRTGPSRPQMLSAPWEHENSDRITFSSEHTAESCAISLTLTVVLSIFWILDFQFSMLL